MSSSKTKPHTWIRLFLLFFLVLGHSFLRYSATEIDVGDFFITDFQIWRQNPLCFLPSNSNCVFFLYCSPTIKQNETNRWAGFSKSTHAVAVCWQQLAISAITHTVGGVSLNFWEWLALPTRKDMLLKPLLNFLDKATQSNCTSP